MRVADDEDRELPEDRIGHVHIRGDNVTRGYYEDPAANAAAFTADGWLRTGDLGLIHGGELYISGRAKEIIFVNGQNYYPHDLEAIAQRAPGLELGKVVAAGVRPRGAQTEQLVVFVLHRGAVAEFLPLATTGGAAHQRADRTRGGGGRARQAHPQDHQRQDPAAPARGRATPTANSTPSSPNSRRCAPRSAGRKPATRTDIEDKLKTICDAALEGKRVDIHDNLFEIGASSLKLIEIHEQHRPRIPRTGGADRAVRFPDHCRAGAAPAGQARTGVNWPERPSRRRPRYVPGRAAAALCRTAAVAFRA